MVAGRWLDGGELSKPPPNEISNELGRPYEARRSDIKIELDSEGPRWICRH